MNCRAALAVAILCAALHAGAQAPRTYLLDAFAQTTSGDERCPTGAAPLLVKRQRGVALVWNETTITPRRKYYRRSPRRESETNG